MAGTENHQSGNWISTTSLERRADVHVSFGYYDGVPQEEIPGQNPDNFRIFGPDETASNRLQSVYDATDKQWNAEFVGPEVDEADLSEGGLAGHIHWPFKAPAVDHDVLADLDVFDAAEFAAADSPHAPIRIAEIGA